MDNVDITMTAMLRPSVLKKTLEGLIEHIVDDQKRFKLIINVDPLGENTKPAKVVNIAKNYFKNVVYNCPDKASFPKAVKWVWKNSTSSFILHFEDDWIINRKININHMIKILKKYPKLSSLRLYKHKTPKGKTIKAFSCIWKYNKDGFYLSKDWKKQFGLNPILIKREFIEECLPRMKDNINPEKQFRGSQVHMRDIIKLWKYGLYTNPGDPPLITDIGRTWIKNTNFSKPKNGPFLTWEINK
jgi:hypothetical protein